MKNWDDMREHRRSEILRLRTAALTCIFIRSGRSLWLREVSQRAVLGELSCEVFPLGVLQGCPPAFLADFSPNQHVVALCLELASPSSWCTLLYPSLLPGHVPRTTLASARPCQISLRTLPQSRLRELHHLSLVRCPETIFERCLLVAFHVIPNKQPSSVSHQPRHHVHGGCHFH